MALDMTYCCDYCDMPFAEVGCHQGRCDENPQQVQWGAGGGSNSVPVGSRRLQTPAALQAAPGLTVADPTVAGLGTQSSDVSVVSCCEVM